MAAPIMIKGSLMGIRKTSGGGIERILSIDIEQRPEGGPARPSMVSVMEQDGRRVAGYLPWINYYDVDEAARQAPDEWTVIEPAEPFNELVEWRPWGLRTGGRAGSLELAELLADLAQTPVKLHRAVGMLGADAQTVPEDGGWSVVDVAMHVIASDSIMSPRVMQIITAPGIVLPDMDVSEVQRILGRAKMSIADRLNSFEARRREWIAALDQITAEELASTGEHSKDGTISVLDICRKVAQHEHEHKRQIDVIATALGYTLG